MKSAKPAQSDLDTKSEIVNSKSANLPIVYPPSFWRAHQTAHVANTTRSVPNSKSEIVNSKSPKFGFGRKSSTNRPLFVQTNPILSASGGFKTLYLAKPYANYAPSATPKTNPKRTQTNPKQTQSLPRQGLSKPKRTRTNPISKANESCCV